MATQTGIVLTNITGNSSEYPENTNRSETTIDLDLLELIEELIVAIDAANSVINAATVAPPQVPFSPKHHLGISSNITATISGLALAAGIGWLLYTNPVLLEGETKVTAQQPTSARASLNKRIIPAPDVAPAPTQPDPLSYFLLSVHSASFTTPAPSITLKRSQAAYRRR